MSKNPMPTEQEIIQAIETVGNMLAAKFKFGYHELKDMKQQAAFFALDVGLPKYDPDNGASLTTFLYTVVHNQLFNFKRDKFMRTDKPCLNCPLKAYDPHYDRSHNQCTAYEDKYDCQPFKEWITRNEAKRNIMNPVDIEVINQESESGLLLEDRAGLSVDYMSVVEIIDRDIPVKFRSKWIKLKNDIRMGESEKRELLEEIHKILEENDISVSN